MNILSLSVLCSLFIKTYSANVLERLHKDKENLIEEELLKAVGGRLTLTPEEKVANDILMKWKHKEIDFGFENPNHFNFSRNYYEYRDHIKDSKVYQIIRKMPKGAVLHVHSTLMMDADYMLKLTYIDHLYACPVWGNFKFQFSDNVPQLPCASKWELLSDIRNASKDVALFDAELKKYFMIEYKPNEDSNEVWIKFNKVVRYMKSLLHYRAASEQSFYDALKRFYDDNILYIEIRSGLNKLYELDGTIHDRLYMARLYRNVTRRFMEVHPDFIGVKLIVTISRNSAMDNVKSSIQHALTLADEMPDFFAGYDLVGQEDLGRPLSEYLPMLAEVKGQLNFYFHGGETNWQGTSTDENLIDAILLGTKRIGHGYALMKHPRLLEDVIKKDIAIEVNVISNVVFSLVNDVRNHPLSLYLAMGLPVVISSDDPGVWGADPLSHDFFITFMGVASRRADLRTLKQLAINSIRYSALNDKKKTSAFRLFNRKWEKFIKDLTNESNTLSALPVTEVMDFATTQNISS